ncbi:hypothetical protein Leryth_003677 [Lithospermum erythrorhizon]|nr:hypothetical protein Leryth_003677 [Lithospermum erythrorhizon]
MKSPSNSNPHSCCLAPEMRRRKLRLLLQSLNRSVDIPSASTPNLLRRVTAFSYEEPRRPPSSVVHRRRTLISGSSTSRWIYGKP